VAAQAAFEHYWARAVVALAAVGLILAFFLASGR
jgi:hypothetical protein